MHDFFFTFSLVFYYGLIQLFGATQNKDVSFKKESAVNNGPAT